MKPIKKHHYSSGSRLANGFSVVRLPTFPQNNSLICWELCLDRLRGEVLSALSQVPLRTPKTSKAPEVSPVAPGGFGERILHAGELLRSDNKWQEVREGSWCQAG